MVRSGSTTWFGMGKKLTIGIVAAIWLFSVVVAAKSLWPSQTHAQQAADPFAVTAAETPAGSGTVVVTIAANATTPANIANVTVNCNECTLSTAPTQPLGNSSQTVDFNSKTKTPATVSFTGLTQVLGGYTFTVSDSDASHNNASVTSAAVLGSAGTTPATPTTPTTPTTPVANAPINPLVSPATCKTTAANATAAGNAASTKVAQTSLFQVIGQDGTKSVFKYVLSFVNLAVLFFFLVIAFANLLHIDVDTYALKKVLLPLIMGILLANFSWLICRFMIEFSTSLYLYIVGSEHGTGVFQHIVTNGYGLADICGDKGIFADFGATILGAFVGTALIFVAAVLIFTLYVLLIARIWVVTLLIILSPLAFLSLGFPLTKNYFKGWWKLFFGWTFMAPASFLILRLAEAMANVGSGPNLTRFILVTALLYYAIQVPFKLGGAWMDRWGGYVSQFKKTASAPAVRIGKGVYERNRDELKDRARLLGWNTPIGRKIGEVQANAASRRDTLAKNVNASRRQGVLKFEDSQRGQRRQEQAGRATVRNKIIDDRAELGIKEGLERFQDSDTKEARDLQTKLAELRHRSKNVETALHNQEGAADLKHYNTKIGIDLQARTARLERTKELEEQELDTAIKAATMAWQGSSEAKHLEREIEKSRHENKLTTSDLDKMRLFTRLSWRKKDEKREEQRNKLALELGKIQNQIKQEIAKGTGTDPAKLTALQAKQVQVTQKYDQKLQQIEAERQKEADKLRAAGQQDYGTFLGQRRDLKKKARSDMAAIERQIEAERSKDGGGDFNTLSTLEEQRKQLDGTNTSAIRVLDQKIKDSRNAARRAHPTLDVDTIARLDKRAEEAEKERELGLKQLDQQISIEQAKKTGTDSARLTQLRAQRKDLKKQVDESGSLAVSATAAEKWLKVSEARMAQYDRQSSPLASKRAFADDFATARAQRTYDVLDKEYGELEKDVTGMQSQQMANENYRSSQERIDDIRDKIKDAVRTKGHEDKLSDFEIETEISKALKEQQEDADSDLAKSIAEQRKLEPADMAAKRERMKKFDQALVKAETVLQRHQRKAADKTPEVVSELVSSLDSEKEDLTYIMARASENPDGIMAMVNAKRANWRNYIARNEKIVEKIGQQAFADMIRMDWKKTAKNVGLNMSNNAMSVRDVQKLAEDFAWRNMEAGMMKDLFAAESKKGEIRVALQMKSPQEYLDQIKLLKNTVQELDSTIRKKESRAKNSSDASEISTLNEELKKDRWYRTVQNEKLQTQESELGKYVDSVKRSTGNQWDQLPDYMKRYFEREQTRDEKGDVIYNNNITGVKDAQTIVGGRKVNYDRVISLVGQDSDSRETNYLNNKSMLQLAQDVYGRGDDTFDPEVFKMLYTQKAESIAELMRNSDSYSNKFDIRDIHKPAAVLGALLRKAVQRRDADALMARRLLFDGAPQEIIEATLSEFAEDPAFKKLAEKSGGWASSLQPIMKKVMDAREINDPAARAAALSAALEEARGLLPTQDDNDIAVSIAGLKRGMGWTNSARLSRGLIGTQRI